MLAVRCEGCRSDVLLGLESVESVENTPEEIIVRFECSCGTRGELHSGRRRRLARAAGVRDQRLVEGHRPRLL